MSQVVVEKLSKFEIEKMIDYLVNEIRSLEDDLEQTGQLIERKSKKFFGGQPVSSDDPLRKHETWLKSTIANEYNLLGKYQNELSRRQGDYR